MSAKEMFEKLGYEQLEVEKPFSDFLIMHYEMELPHVKKVIYFLSVNEIKIYLEDKKGNVYPPIIELSEIQAINKQIEELGWNK